MSAAETRAKLNEQRAAHAAFLEALTGEDGKYNMTTDQVGQFRKRNDEMTELAKKWEEEVEAEKAQSIEDAKAERAGRAVEGEVKDATPPKLKTLDDVHGAIRKGIDANADMLKRLGDGGQGSVRFSLPPETKTIIDIADITNPNNFVGYAPDAIAVGDVERYLPAGQTDSNSIRYYILNADTSNAAFVTNVTAATDAVLTWTLTTDEVEDVQAWVPVGRDIISDIPMLQSMVTGMLARRLQKVVAAALLVGNGTSPNIWGVFTRTNFQTQAKGADPTMDAVHKGITKVANIGGDANLAVFHPNDWQSIRLTRTGDGLYVLGNPTESGPMRLWGLPVVTSVGMTENTGGVLDTSYSMVFSNGGLQVEISTEHSTYFTERKLAIALSRRIAAAHFLPTAACTITGI